MFTKIIEFIRPPPGPRDTMPTAAADRVNPVERREPSERDKHESASHPPAESPPTEDVLPTEDAVMVSLEAIRVTILGAPVSAEAENAPPPIAAYQRNQKPSAPGMEDISDEMAEALRMIDALARAGVSAIPVPTGMDFLTALKNAVRK